MNKICLLFLLFYGITSFGQAQNTGSRPRVFVFTDVNNEPDDEESLVRFLVYSNEYDIEGLVAHTSCWLKKGIREDLIRKQVAAYGLVRPNLAKHASGFPTQQALEAVISSGQPEYGMAATGKGKSTPGSRLLIKAAQKQDNRPLWVLLWGGANTLAQALQDAREELSAAELNQLIAKLRVYSISDQDDAGAWLRQEFPALFYIADPSKQDHLSYYASTWNGISGDQENNTGVNYFFNLVDNSWLEQNISKNHGPLGALYPPLTVIMEGDTPSFLGLINNGLGWAESPAFGGWGGRYHLYQPHGETRPLWTSNLLSRDTFEYEPGKKFTSNGTTIWRWRDHFQYDFAARMDWCVADSYKKANHNPNLVVNNDQTKKVLYINASGRKKITLSAAGTKDPDGQPVNLKWWIYPEAGTVQNATLTITQGETTEVDLSGVKGSGTVHVILQGNDNGSPNLYAYRRVVITL
ncbi:DUF1593 domain-containing protein [Adhaeribacter swui]|uniref:DUF1593 domain-containing protein n=1 Tax=Adhaeribacter swui TaxID=2086471 RepID=A0A7G7GC72_9BACT|nr:DUF1593 domain-containing protein [Adhaeribacter swui]QNF34756.1 DUF1593 domain-containing protein [Adhaeribacter swui]